jgi:hypothetical protein
MVSCRDPASASAPGSGGGGRRDAQIAFRVCTQYEPSCRRRVVRRSGSPAGTHTHTHIPYFPWDGIPLHHTRTGARKLRQPRTRTHHPQQQVFFFFLFFFLSFSRIRRQYRLRAEVSADVPILPSPVSERWRRCGFSPPPPGHVPWARQKMTQGGSAPDLRVLGPRLSADAAARGRIGS